MRPILGCALIALATSASPLSSRVPTGQQIGFAQYLQLGYAGVKRDLIAAAEKMPAADYGFKPSSMPEMRTYAQVITHVAAGLYGACATAKGVPNPALGKDLERTSNKPEVAQILAESFAFCDDAFSSLTDATAMEFVTQGKLSLARGAVLAGLLAHNAEMYGISSVYLRAKNIVPPASERSKQP